MIAVNEPLLAGKEQEYVRQCLETGWISSAGSFIDEFERGWSSYCGMQYGIAVSNGTVALESALAVLDLPKGSEVIVPSFTIISCVQAITKAGYKPVLVDCDPDTWCMSIDEIVPKITDRTRAIMPVHMYGHPVDMVNLMAIAAKYNLLIIEDAAEAHGAEVVVKSEAIPELKRCGGFGHISCFSFYANKIITTGEGGMILTNDAALAERLRAYRNLCFIPERRFLHEEIGDNYRLTNLQAAIGVAQMEQIEEFLVRKRHMAELYYQGLKDLPITLQKERPWARSVHWMYGLVLNDSVNMDAKQFAERLMEYGVQTRPFFLGMHEQPVFHKMGLFVNERYPITERIARRGLYLPSGLALIDEQISIVIEAVRRVLLH